MGALVLLSIYNTKKKLKFTELLISIAKKKYREKN